MNNARTSVPVKFGFADEDVCQRVHSYLSSKHFPRFRDLKIEVRRGIVTVRGTVGSFHRAPSRPEFMSSGCRSSRTGRRHQRVGYPMQRRKTWPSALVGPEQPSVDDRGGGTCWRTSALTDSRGRLATRSFSACQTGQRRPPGGLPARSGCRGRANSYRRSQASSQNWPPRCMLCFFRSNSSISGKCPAP